MRAGVEALSCLCDPDSSTASVPGLGSLEGMWHRAGAAPAGSGHEAIPSRAGGPHKPRPAPTGALGAAGTAQPRRQGERPRPARERPRLLTGEILAAA